MSAITSPFGSNSINTAVPMGTVISFAGQVQYFNKDKNTAWPSCNASTDKDCCAPQSAGTLPAASTSAPLIPVELEGWMLCDGRLLAISQHPGLFGVLGYMYGGSASQCQFALPDCRGLFLRGVDAAAGMDADVSQRQAAASGQGSANGVGSLQCDALQQHQHDYNKVPGSGSETYLSAGEGTPGVIGADLTGDPTNASPTDPMATNTVRSSSETRPSNIAMNYLIKTG
jgi:microcystin-dependent protein